jgi:hypothetical protein
MRLTQFFSHSSQAPNVIEKPSFIEGCTVIGATEFEVVSAKNKGTAEAMPL